MKFVLTILLLIFLPIVCTASDMISLYANKPSPKPGENVILTATVKKQCTIIWMNNATGTVLALCPDVAANCMSHVTSRYRFSYQGVNIIKFDWTEDGFVWKAQCDLATATYIFSEPNGSPSINPGLGILFMGIITILVIGS